MIFWLIFFFDDIVGLGVGYGYFLFLKKGIMIIGYYDFVGGFVCIIGIMIF